ncbi:cell division protein FtsQ [Rhodovulum iodosum]|uniref:Cell division protein FtsQ n=1 Tax=Rhodovulum iodosum TaxID=68291 RepID=A0ABV3XNY3_9RHOB|nr:cell division protein FtsQ/DivIB [Rhodovulum robiginosum]RSK37977.1 FtsQ-type POTRA domain-containing protein [Rhodovulum robiginosum]
MRPLIRRRSRVEPPPLRDPAPSRLAYRAERLWLTPLFRRFLRIGLPVVLVAAAVAAFFADAGRREALAALGHDLRQSFTERPEFMVGLMAIDGASREVDEDIREILPIDFPVSSFDLDLEAMRQTVAGLDAVARAELRIRPGGILQVSVQERVPAVVWRSDNGLELLDAQGHRVAPLAARGARPDLPLVAGTGADGAMPEALHLIDLAAPIADRFRGLVRVGERRWDVVLDRGQRILLPETGAPAALERVIALNQAEEMLARDLVTVDMRQAGRPTLRLAPGAIEEFRRITTAEAEAGDG